MIHFKDAPKDLRHIMIEVSSLNAVMKVLKLLEPEAYQSENTMLLNRLKGPQGLVLECQSALAELNDLLPSPMTHTEKDRRP